MDDYLNLLQWPAMLVTVIASYWVASSREKKRGRGFWAFLVSNVLWVVWGWHTDAYALVALQFCLAAMNLRGVKKTEAATESRDVA